MRGTSIVGLGHYVPERRVANAEIEARLGLESGWIKRRTGVEARRYVADHQALSDIAVEAGARALAQSGLSKTDIGLLLLATSTPDHLLPPSAPLVAHRLGLSNAGGIDMAGACGGFIYALAFADAMTRMHGTPVLVIAANILSRRMNERDRASSVLFADAAGAAVLAPQGRRDAGAVGIHLATQGAGYDLIKIPSGGSRTPFTKVADPAETLMVISNGQAVFAEAVGMMTSCARRALAKAGLSARDVVHFIPHQANARMMSAVAHQLDIAPDRLRSTIAEYANSSAATIPLTLSVHSETRQYQSGDIVLMTAAGAGLTGGAIAFRW